MIHDKTTIYAEQIRPAQIPETYELRPITGRAPFDEDRNLYVPHENKSIP